MHWLSSGGLNFDRLSQRDRRRWHNNDRPDCAAAPFLRGSPAFLGTPTDTFYFYFCIFVFLKASLDFLETQTATLDFCIFVFMYLSGAVQLS